MLPSAGQSLLLCLGYSCRVRGPAARLGDPAPEPGRLAAGLEDPCQVRMLALALLPSPEGPQWGGDCSVLRGQRSSIIPREQASSWHNKGLSLAETQKGAGGHSRGCRIRRLESCSVCFLIEPSTSSPEMTPPTMDLSFPIY